MRPTNRASWRGLPFLVAGLGLGFAACTGPSGGGTTTGSGTTSSSGGSVQPDALCDILAGLQRQCWSCHGTAPPDASLGSLVTIEQLKAPSALDPSKSYAERSALRMEVAKNPMPPGEEPTSAPELVALLKAWIAAGYPPASCGDEAKDPYAAAAKCSGEQFELGVLMGDTGSPGRACNTCHQQVNSEKGSNAPMFMIAGTIFPTAHEPDDCLTHAAEGAKVEITDANGKVVLLEANLAGNFFYRDPDLVFPYTAKVIFEGRERRMALPQTNGACNECHTQAGTQQAPGRVLLP